ncbi:MAG: TraB/GumN family protein [Syntrophomonadaceae bacterium]|nr:TraB/GumN family protein [Syntrophomonadaceae bacterium]
MEENITRVEYNGKNIILVATAHVSKRSAELVKQVIEDERPDSVCVELDDERYQSMMNPEAWENTDIVKVIKSKRVGFLLASLVLSAYQKRIARQLDTTVGQEMTQAIKSADETGAELVMADRKIQTTFLRVWRGLGFWEKMKMLFNLLFSFEDDEENELTELDLQEMLQTDVLEAAMSSIHEDFPKIGEYLITERDQYLAYSIKNAPGTKIVAVLGGAHVAGVKEEIFKEQDMERLSQTPQRKVYAKYIGWTMPVLIVALIIYAFAVNVNIGLQQVTTWFIWKCALAGIFTAVTLAHPLSILTALVLAPFTSLNPMLACGWFAGLVEASIKKPTVEDVQNIPVDIFSVKGFFRNRFLKIILVVIMANIGSSIGTFVAGFNILGNLFNT